MEKFPEVITIEWLEEYLGKNITNKEYNVKIIEKFKVMGDTPKFRRILHLRPRFKGEKNISHNRYGVKMGRKSNVELRKRLEVVHSGNVVKDYLMANYVEKTENGGYIRKGERYKLLLDTMYDDAVKNKNVTAAKFLFDNAFRIPKVDGRKKVEVDNSEDNDEDIDNILKNAGINPLTKVNKDIME